MTVTQPPSAPVHNANPLFMVLAGLAALLTPIAVVMTAVRLLLLPWFLTFEYNTPNFPADSYGFTYQDRIYYGGLSMQFLTNNAPIEYWNTQRFPNGEPVYSERELSHFIDAKVTLGGALNVWKGSLAVLIVFGLWAWFGGWWAQYLRGLAWGGWLTLGLIVIIMLLVIVSFDQLFVVFHEIFFPQGNWMFAYSDTFIRLFPERFWRDIFIYIGVFSAAAGAALGFFLRRR